MRTEPMAYLNRGAYYIFYTYVFKKKSRNAGFSTLFKATYFMFMAPLSLVPSRLCLSGNVQKHNHKRPYDQHNHNHKKMIDHFLVIMIMSMTMTMLLFFIVGTRKS